MSFILKGIDLPKENLRVICLFPNGAEELVVIDADSGATAGRPIQAIQIPKGHGRLIDEDEIFKRPHCGECNDATLEAIYNAPTILEEE